ncbi:hypothetical protein SAY87_012443 [Trapa incisa]|uniref:Uncharacterized protein n=1 Tax=Trapa incisa TaxID=236973 RepID=A0AAN7GKX9_9MYRT|nr:hypothetical protein SAY87_012443 [Trapa incisa]
MSDRETEESGKGDPGRGGDNKRFSIKRRHESGIPLIHLKTSITSHPSEYAHRDACPTACNAAYPISAPPRLRVNDNGEMLTVKLSLIQNAEGHSENTLFNGLAAEYGSPCRIPMNMQWRLWLVYRFPKWESTQYWEFEKGAIMMGFQATHLSKTGFHPTPQSQVQEDDDHYPTEWILPYGCMVQERERDQVQENDEGRLCWH